MYTDGVLESTVDEASTVNEYSWCPGCGAPEALSLPLSKALGWTYNSDKQKTGFQDARSNTSSYIYGDAGVLKEFRYPDGARFLYSYDNYGRLRQIRSPRNRNHKFTYSNAGFVSSETFHSGEYASQYSVDTDGTYISTTDAIGTVSYTYNGAKQVLTASHNWSSRGLSPVQLLTYTYNTDGSVDTLTWASGGVTVVSWSYGYDAAGQLTTVTNSFGEQTDFAYDGEGKITSQTNDNGTTLDYTYYQPRGWATQLLYEAGGTAFARYDLQYDSGNNTVGNLTQVTELDSSQVVYTYDALYRLLSETRTGTGAYSKSYTYDLANNVTEVDSTTFATYDVGNKISSLSGGSVSQDADGNITAASGAGFLSGTQFEWHTKNYLNSHAANGHTTLEYLYDYDGMRRFRSEGPWWGSVPKCFYLYDGIRLIGELCDGVPTMAYTWGPDGLISQRELPGTPQSLWYHFGPQGETRQLTDSTGTVVDQYRYTAYGLPLYTSGSSYNPHRYGGKVGYYTDGPNGLLLATYRWYSPQLMRWLSRDPIRFAGGDNVYAYVDGRPVGYLDPDGLSPYHDDAGRKPPVTSTPSS